MNYDEAKAIAEQKRPTLLVSLAGGRKRYAKFSINGYGDVDVTLFSTIIATFSPEHVRVSTGGYNTATTREALNALLRPMGTFWTEKRITQWHHFVRDERKSTIATEGMCIAYNGNVRMEGGRPFPLTDDVRATRV